MDIERRIELISQVGEEIITLEELRMLLSEKKRPIAYDGFEPSGHVHIAQGLLRAININKMLKAGCRFKMLVADWHAWANNKMGGSLENIQLVGKYLIEVWKACGLDTNNVEFVWASDLVKNDEYWKKVMQIARHSTINRIIRCGQIMGRKDAEMQQASQILYPCMQAADIFQLEVDICQLGMDQRKVNVLAREIGPKLGFWKPVIVSHHMLMGLLKIESSEKDKIERTIELKMSKSKPDTAIFMTDTKEEVERKIAKAYCPEREVNENPVLEYCKYIIFEKFKTFEIERLEKYGGNVSFETYEELEKAYASGSLHPMDLKNAVAKKINELLDPVRKHFEKNAKAKELLEIVNKLEVTR
ncbi:MAG: tyrosine--tRNA ligase [Candidatus Aenigmatarchaeota archaeon]